MHQAAQQARAPQDVEGQAALADNSMGGGELEHMQTSSQLDAIRALANGDPKRVANVMRTWVEKWLTLPLSRGPSGLPSCC